MIPDQLPVASMVPSGATATADGGATVRFSGLEGGLRLRSGAQAVGFELCGSIEGSCRYALAQVVGDQVRLTGDGKPVTRVRYAWADYPVMNLYDETPLPVGPFDIPVER